MKRSLPLLCLLASLCTANAQTLVLKYETLAEMQASDRNNPNTAAIVHGASTSDWSEWNWVVGDAAATNSSILASTHPGHYIGRWYKKTPDFSAVGGGSDGVWTNNAGTGDLVASLNNVQVQRNQDSATGDSLGFQFNSKNAGSGSEGRFQLTTGTNQNQAVLFSLNDAGNANGFAYFTAPDGTVTLQIDVNDNAIAGFAVGGHGGWWGPGILWRDRNTTNGIVTTLNVSNLASLDQISLDPKTNQFLIFRLSLSQFDDPQHLLGIGDQALTGETSGYNWGALALGYLTLSQNSNTNQMRDMIAVGDYALGFNAQDGEQEQMIAIGDGPLSASGRTGNQSHIIAIGYFDLSDRTGSGGDADVVAVGRSNLSGDSGGGLTRLVVLGADNFDGGASALTDVIAIGSGITASGDITNATAIGPSITLTNSNEFHLGYDQKLVVGNVGTPVAQILSGTATLDFNLSAVTFQDLTITVTGAGVNDTVWLGVPNGSIANGVSYFGWVSATNTVTVRASTSTGTPNPASGTFRAAVMRF